MDPRTYCKEAVAQLLAEHPARLSDPVRLQRAVLLAYFSEQQLSAPEFVGHLEELESERQEMRQPTVAAAARAILADWRERAAVGRRVPCDEAS